MADRKLHLVRLAQRADEVGDTRVLDGGGYMADDVVFTSERRDRYGDVVRMAGADLASYLANPVVLFSHGATSAACPVIGRGVAIQKTKTRAGLPAMSMSIEFAGTPLAREVAELWRGGFLRATSIGFQPKSLATIRVIGPDGEPTDDDPGDFLSFMPDGYGFEFREWEMLENSVVPVPANPDALGRMRRMPEVCRAVGLSHRSAPVQVPAIGRATVHRAACPGGHCVGCAGDYAPEPDAVEAEEPEAAEVRSASSTPGASIMAPAPLNIVVDGKVVAAHIRRESARAAAPPAIHKAACPGGHCQGCAGEVPDAGEEQAPPPPVDERAAPRRWNRQLGEAFDVETEPLAPSSTEVDFAARFLGCGVSEMCQIGTDVPSVRLGSFLSALERQLFEDGYAPCGVRNMSYGDGENPPKYERIQLNAKSTRRFMVEGVRFFRGVDGRPALAVRLWPTYFGLRVVTYSRDAEDCPAEHLLDATWDYARGAGNYLRGESFSVGGEFLPPTDETWGSLFLSPSNERSLRIAARTVNEQGAAADCRGILMMGPPGNGKTLSCRVMRNECAATFVWLSSRDFAYLGSFGGLTAAFDLARELAPAILCIEDADSWLDRYTVDLLKTEMDGVGRHKGVVTAVTTNHPEALPEALIDRPGRFHDVLLYAAPDAEARVRMLAAWSPGLSEAERATVVEATDGMSGAYVREVTGYADTLARQEGLEPGAAVLIAIEKIAEQRRLIDENSGGGRHRAPKPWSRRAASGLGPALVRRHGTAPGGRSTEAALAIEDVARALRETSVETCRGCGLPQPYHRASGRFAPHERSDGGRCASRGVAVESPRGLTLRRLLEVAGDSLGHDARGAAEALLASGGVDLPIGALAGQVQARAVAMVRAVAREVAEVERVGKVLSRKNESAIGEATAALDAVGAALAAVSESISKAREALQSVLAAAKPPEGEAAPEEGGAPAEGRGVEQHDPAVIDEERAEAAAAAAVRAISAALAARLG